MNSWVTRNSRSRSGKRLLSTSLDSGTPTGTTSKMGRAIAVFGLDLDICHREFVFRIRLAKVSERGIDLPE
jgi:hypothetical protein